MHGRYLLDTNIIIGFFANDRKIHKRMAKASEVFIPCVALGELYFGAHKSSRPIENLSVMEEFAHCNTVLACNEETARRYGEMKDWLRKKGMPIPENDIWIAAIAEQYGLVLVSRDAHFDAVRNVQVEVW